MAYDIDQKERIEKYVKTFNKTITEDDVELLDYVVEAVIDRTLLYLNRNELNQVFERVVADVVGGIFNKYKVNLNNQGTDLAINSVSDNGQSISYANEIRNYLANSTDNELFSGFAGLLNRYRRVNVVSYKWF